LASLLTAVARPVWAVPQSASQTHEEFEKVVADATSSSATCVNCIAVSSPEIESPRLLLELKDFNCLIVRHTDGREVKITADDIWQALQPGGITYATGAK
jgi:hypothetical protein